MCVHQIAPSQTRSLNCPQCIQMANYRSAHRGDYMPPPSDSQGGGMVGMLAQIGCNTQEHTPEAACKVLQGMREASQGVRMYSIIKPRQAIHSLIHSLIYLFSRSFSHQFTQFFTHSIHSFTSLNSFTSLMITRHLYSLLLTAL